MKIVFISGLELAPMNKCQLSHNSRRFDTFCFVNYSSQTYIYSSADLVWWKKRTSVPWPWQWCILESSIFIWSHYRARFCGRVVSCPCRDPCLLLPSHTKSALHANSLPWPLSITVKLYRVMIPWLADFACFFNNSWSGITKPNSCRAHYLKVKVSHKQIPMTQALTQSLRTISLHRQPNHELEWFTSRK